MATKIVTEFKSYRLVHSVSRLLLPLSLLGVVACRPVGVSPASAQQGVPVTIAAVQRDLVDNGEEFVANLVSRQSVELKPRVAGQVIRIFAQAGEPVSASQPILQIDAREQAATVASRATQIDTAQADVDEARADVEQAIADVNRARATLASAEATLENLRADRSAKVADLTLAEKQFERYKTLQSEGAVSAQILDQFTSSLTSARSNLNALDARIVAQQATIVAQRSDIHAQRAKVDAERTGIQRAKRQITQAQANTQQEQARLQYYSITAPFAGAIGDIPVKEGDFVSQSTILATVTKNDALEVNLQVPVEKASRVNKGTRVEVLDGEGKLLATSRVFFISPKTDADTQSVLIKAQLENTTGKLRADQFIKARMIWQRDSSLLIPKTAIVPVAGQNFVYVVQEKDGKLRAQQKAIKVGVLKGNNQQVTEGLTDQDKVITSGIQKLSDGAPIVNAETLTKPKSPEG
jgi:RND family efflux transporter MFP subunit